MEIISYVHQPQKNKLSLRFFESSKNRRIIREDSFEKRNKKERKTSESIKQKLFKNRRIKKQRSFSSDLGQGFSAFDQDSSLVFQNFTPEVKSYSIPKVKADFSIHLLMKNIGQWVSAAGSFIARHILKLIIAIAVAVLITVFTVAGNNAVKHAFDSTGPLKISSENTLDIENLDKIMESFAMDAETDMYGNLLDDSYVLTANYTQPVTYQYYKVQYGDTIGGITKKFGLKNISTLIAINNIDNVRHIISGQKLKIPSIDGMTYTVKAGDTLEKIVKEKNISLATLVDVNELNSEDLVPGQVLFLPGAILDSKTLKLAMGDKFTMPIKASFRWSSPYGKRVDPIAGVESFHTGTDMACPTGTPIYAALAGKVITSGVSRIYGNYVIIDHGNGYQSLYAHMSKIIATKGQWVNQGAKIGLVGSTGYSTGPHLHFTVYKNGKTIDPMSVLK